MQYDTHEAIIAASDARRRATARLEAAERAAQTPLGPEEMVAALLAALQAQATLTDALMRVCSILADQAREPSRGIAALPLPRLN
jgi:hypothetical protein